VTTHFSIDLQKQVPHGAGLGGGSGNAAAALWAINALSGNPASETDLLNWSAKIGSDISVFFSNGAAYCTGRGEIVQDVPPPVPLETPLLLVKPPIGLSTPAIFKALDLSRRSGVEPRTLLERMQRGGRVTQALCVNDLEQPAFDTLPALLELKTKLQGTGLYEAVFMTGSGSTIVCTGSDQVPPFVEENGSLFTASTRLMVREPGQWYRLPTAKSAGAIAAAPASA
jgi:4-diphosphocytidyl-2-C-methyl-D-erythritol kinase